MTDRRAFLMALGAAFALPSITQASAGIVTPHQAHDAVTDGSMILVDIRTPAEWEATGVAKGAWLLDMTHDQFGPRLLAVLDRNPDHKVAIICRTGNRSGYLMGVLAKNGITGVYDVSAGMAGGPNGMGWIPAGLPVVDAVQAYDAMPGDLRAG
ncbi:rhodanese-like domain-containing protein [Phaeobacter marinintestinus]|uniref:rhodanese-like domain-containing protein n=1 Tax=Falsiphaeobacter marinintestinus TaxID=1492905 RepID=UPI001646BC97|nr:rhodanese-like domain-containing protein [Phaeobacter marinintestinus]